MAQKRPADQGESPPKRQALDQNYVLITMKEAREFKDLVSAILPLRSEANVSLNADGIVCQVADSAHVCFIKFNLDKDRFGLDASDDVSFYSCPRNTTVGINFEHVHRILSSMRDRKSTRLNSSHRT